MAHNDSGGARLDDYRVIDDYTGFKIWASESVVDWAGMRTRADLADKRNPQDFVRAVPDNQRVDNPRAEPPDQFISSPVLPSDL